MQSLVLGSGTLVAPGKSLWNSTSCATDRQSLCHLSLNAQINSSKAVVKLWILPNLSQNTAVVYRLLWPDIFLLSVKVNWISSSTRENIIIFPSKLISCEAELMILMPIVFINQGEAPRRII